MVEMLSNLPDLAEVGALDSSTEEKIGLVLGLLRRTAIEHRQSTSRPFYSIRTVARHFHLPSTTVARMYDRLKIEGLLGSIWGSKTIIEPLEMDKDIRLRAIVGLPVALSSFSVSPGYRRFFRLMQQALWKQRFGSRLIFHNNGFVESAGFARMMIDYGVDIVIWLTPPSRASNAVAQLKDRGIRLISIMDGVPLNGEPGHYASRQHALAEGLASWKSTGIRSVVLIYDRQSTSASTQRMLQAALVDVDIHFTRYEADFTGPNVLRPRPNRLGSGIIFTSAQSVVRFANRSVSEFLNLSRQKRIMLLDGEVDLPIETSLNTSFDRIEFDWRTMARRIVSDLVANGAIATTAEQSIFKAKWRGASKLEAILR
jgi:hypothetical protein